MISLSTELVFDFIDGAKKNSAVERYGISRYFLEEYSHQKSHLYEAFGGSFFKKKKIYVDHTRDNDFIGEVYTKFVERVLSYGNASEPLFNLLKDISLEDFATNKHKGIKITKHINRILNKSFVADRIINEYSFSLMQLKPVEGILVLSIHPFDYIGMSESGYGWSSCQSLDGDYAAGTFSLLNDSSTMVAYLAAKEQMTFPWGQWSPKKWRMLVHTDKTHNLFVFNKHYPFSSPDLEEATEGLIKEIWSDRSFVYKRSFIAEECTDPIVKHPESVHYDDIYHNPPRIISTTEDIDDLSVVTGSELLCFKCCEFTMTQADSFLCSGCDADSYVECENCSEAIPAEDAFHGHTYISGRRFSALYCEDCYYDIKSQKEEEEK